MPSIKYKDKTYGSATFPFVEMTREEYDMLPPSKQNDGTLYLISDDDVGWGAERCVYDNTQSGLAASNVQDVVDELDRIIDTIENPTFSEASARDNIISGESLAIIFGKIKRVINDLETIAFSGMANNVEYDNTTSGMTATDVQGGLDELNANKANVSHTHGNIQNGGTLQASDVAIASGDKLVVTDSSDSSKIARTSLSFDGSTTSQALTKAGSWQTFNNYSHPTGAGNNHIPAGGSSGQILRWSSAGTATWGADNNTVYTHPTGNGNNHIPAGGSSGQILRWSAAGTAAWGADNNTTTGTSYAAGSCPNNTTFATNGSVANVYNAVKSHQVAFQKTSKGGYAKIDANARVWYDVTNQKPSDTNYDWYLMNAVVLTNASTTANFAVIEHTSQSGIYVYARGTGILQPYISAYWMGVHK